MKDVNKMTRRQLERAAWLGKFEVLVVHTDRKHAGKIDWPTANHYYNQGRSEVAAAREYIEARK